MDLTADLEIGICGHTVWWVPDEFEKKEIRVVDFTVAFVVSVYYDRVIRIIVCLVPLL